MADYSKMYVKIFNTVTDVINILQRAQIETEEIFINQDEQNLVLLKYPDLRETSERKKD